MAALIGVWAPGLDIARAIGMGLRAQQHRGTKYAKIAISNGSDVFMYGDAGLVHQVFSNKELDALKGISGIGIISEKQRNQPYMIETRWGKIVLAFEGKIFDRDFIYGVLEKRAKELSAFIQNPDKIKIDYFSTLEDIELIALLIASSLEHDLNAAIIKDCLHFIKDAASYALLILSSKRLYAARDPRGMWPLAIGQLERGGHYVVSSETCAFQLMEAETIDFLKPGCSSAIEDEWHEIPATHVGKSAFCALEIIHRQRPDSLIEKALINSKRALTGDILWQTFGCLFKNINDFTVSYIPDGGRPVAIGFAKAARVPIEEVFIKNRYVSDLIAPPGSIKKTMIEMELSPIGDAINGNKIILIENFCVRGNHLKFCAKMLFDNGAREVHVLIASPMIRYPCKTSIRMNTTKSFLAPHDIDFDPERVWAEISGGKPGSLRFLSNEVFGVIDEEHQLCTACFDGNYPV